MSIYIKCALSQTTIYKIKNNLSPSSSWNKTETFSYEDVKFKKKKEERKQKSQHCLYHQGLKDQGFLDKMHRYKTLIFLVVFREYL